jgi:hypothetical protein
MRNFLLILIPPLLASLASCRCGCFEPRTVQRLPVAEQQAIAVVHDPYADQNIAPEVVGGRPREYQKDFSEPQRAQLLQNSWFGQH